MSEEQRQDQEQPSLIKRLHNNPNAQRVLFILALIYIISPFDLIPGDLFTLGPGMLDDLAVLIAEVAQFMVYMKNKKASFEKKVQDAAINQNQNMNDKEENK
ncbi:MAG: DUF1232 domain-containing protein [Candidatus Riflebacteria bacterium]|jgi:uncharacterized membrane protein YkvA (DUF1232 family)|nr:DUF1232 domain-containing protein [Candidatus Riflebacteria bacterium]